MDNPKINDMLKNVREKIDEALKEPKYLNSDVDNDAYFYDSTSGTVLKGSFRNVWKKLAQKAIIDLVVYQREYSQPRMPIRIKEAFDKESIELLYGPIVEVKNEG